MFYKLNEDKTVSRVAGFPEIAYGRSNIVAKSCCGPYEVSTVFIPITGGDWHFETMIFGPGDGEFQRRYTYYASALEGHKEAVKNLLDNKLHFD